MKKLIATTLASAMLFSFSTTIFANTIDTDLSVMPISTTNTATNEASDNFVITTNGDSTLSVTPDIAKISFGITNTEKTSSQTAQNNQEAVNNVVEALINYGISENDISSDYYYIYPNYNYDNGDGTQILSYTATNTLNVIVRNIDDVAKVIDIALSNGATSSNTVTYDVENKQPYYEKALQNAINSALLKGNMIAKSVGFENPKIVSINENSTYSVAQPYSESLGLDTMDSIDSKSYDLNNNVTIYASVNVTLGN